MEGQIRCSHIEQCHDCREKIRAVERERDELKEAIRRSRGRQSHAVRMTALQVYDYYKDKLRAGGRSDAIVSIGRLIKGGASLDLLYACIDRALAQYKKEGRDPQYYPQANNFFGLKAYWEDFRDVKTEPDDDDPDYVTDFGGHKRRVR